MRKARISMAEKRKWHAWAVVAVGLAVALAVTAAVSALPSEWTKIDVSSKSLFTLSEQTKQIVSQVNKDITLYWVVTVGNEDETLGLLLERYEDLNGHIHVERVDLTKNPEFGSLYTDKTVFENSVIAVSDTKNEYISYYEIYSYDDSAYASTGTMLITFEAESCITNAIHYLISDVVPTVYVLTGHGETELGDALEASIEKDNLVLQELSFLDKDAVPEDCACLILCNLSADLSSEDTEKIREYLRDGGSMLLITNNVQTGTMSNLLALMEENYELGLADGIIVEGEEYYYVSQPVYLLPQINSHQITLPLLSANYLVVLPFAQPLKSTGALPTDVTVTSLLLTTSSAYSKVEYASATTLEKEEGDLSGPFTVAAAIESTRGTKIVWITSVYMLDESVDEIVYGGNTDFVMNSLSWLCGQLESISIRSHTISGDYYTVNAGTARNLSILLIGVFPIVILAAGSIILIRRRKR